MLFFFTSLLLHSLVFSRKYGKFWCGLLCRIDASDVWMFLKSFFSVQRIWVQHENNWNKLYCMLAIAAKTPIENGTKKTIVRRRTEKLSECPHSERWQMIKCVIFVWQFKWISTNKNCKLQVLCHTFMCGIRSKIGFFL